MTKLRTPDEVARITKLLSERGHRLSPRWFEMTEAFYIGGKSMKQIAEDFKISDGRVREIVSRAIRRLIAPYSKKDPPNN